MCVQNNRQPLFSLPHPPELLDHLAILLLFFYYNHPLPYLPIKYDHLQRVQQCCFFTFLFNPQYNNRFINGVKLSSSNFTVGLNCDKHHRNNFADDAF